MKMEWSLACAGNDWLKARGRERERFLVEGTLQQRRDPSVFLSKLCFYSTGHLLFK